MKRYHVNVFDTADSLPVVTYVTNSSEAVANCVAKLLADANISITRIEVLDSTQTLPLAVIAPHDLDSVD